MTLSSASPAPTIRPPLWPRTAQRMVRWLDQPLVNAMMRRTAVDDVLGALHPLLSLSEVRARVTAIVQETADTRTFCLQPNAHWLGARAGQFVRIRVEVNGRKLERVYSVSSAPTAHSLAITIKRQSEGVVSRHLHQSVRVGDVVTISQAAGEFVLPCVPTNALPRKILLLSAGSGITPVMAMLRSLHAQGYGGKLVFAHMCRNRTDMIFGAELEQMAAAMPALQLVTHFTQAHGRLNADMLSAMLPDLADFSTWMCGPAPWMDSMQAHWSTHLPDAALYNERFGRAPTMLTVEGAPAAIECSSAGVRFVSKGTDTLLVQAERAGLQPKHGCRMGICASCQCVKTQGTVQNLITGEVSSAPGETIRLCISAARSDLTLAL